MKKIKSHIKDIISNLLLIIIKNRFGTIIVVLLITILALFAVSTIRLNPKWTNALPRNNTFVNEYLNLNEDPMRGSIVYAVIEGQSKEKVADAFTSELLNIPHVRYIFDGRINRPINESSLYYLNNDKLLRILEISQNPNIDQIVNFFREKIIQTITSGQNPVYSSITIKGWYLLFNAFARALGNQSHIPISHLTDIMFFNTGTRIRSADNESLLLLIGTDISEGSIDNLDEIAASLEAAKIETEFRFKNARIKLTGYPISASDEMRSIMTSGERMTILALILITITLGFFYGGWKFMATSIGVLCIALIWILAVIRILFGELNTVTMILGLVLIGLGIDFCIHWMNYRINQNKNNFNCIDDIKLNWRSAGPPILIGAITTAGAFLSLLVLNVQSLNEFGIMSSFGIILTALLILLILPLFTRKINYTSVYINLQRKLFCLVPVLIANKRKILIIVVSLFIISLWLLKNLKYEYNFAKLQTGGLSSYYIKEDIIGKFGFASDVFINRVKGIDEADVQKQKMKNHKEIGFVLSISDFIPSERDQKVKKIFIDKIKQSSNEIKLYSYKIEDLEKLRIAFLELRNVLKSIALKDNSNNSIYELVLLLDRIIELMSESRIDKLNDFNSEWVRTFSNRTNQLMNSESISFTHQPEQLRFIFQTSQPGEFIQYIYPKNNTWEKENIKAIEKRLTNISPPVVGLSRLSWHMSQKILRDILTMIVLSTIFIMLALSVTQKSLKYTVLTLVPLILGIVFTLSTLVLFDIKISLYNLIGLPIVLGIGIDDGLHIVYAYRKNPEGGTINAVLKAGPAVFLTTITSMIGFGCLAFYIHPGISSLGLVTLIGIAWCFVSTIFFLPILIDFYSKKVNRKG
jgi:predicted RND superfamily exporter protein